MHNTESGCIYRGWMAHIPPSGKKDPRFPDPFVKVHASPYWQPRSRVTITVHGGFLLKSNGEIPGFYRNAISLTEEDDDNRETYSLITRAIFSAASPFPNTELSACVRTSAIIAARILRLSAPTRTFHPPVSVSIHSVFSRRVMHGIPIHMLLSGFRRNR